jgi:hypothetical protein
LRFDHLSLSVRIKPNPNDIIWIQRFLDQENKTGSDPLEKEIAIPAEQRERFISFGYRQSKIFIGGLQKSITVRKIGRSHGSWCNGC